MGTCFSHPVVREPDVLDKTESKRRSRHTGKSIMVKHVLIVDDVKINCDIIEDYILLYDFTPKISKVYNGDDALKAVEDNKDINLILVDIKMIPIDGYELTHRLRQDLNFDQLIVGVTGMVDRISNKKALHSGMDDVCAKPLDFDHLLATITKYGYELPQ